MPDRLQHRVHASKGNIWGGGGREGVSILLDSLQTPTIFQSNLGGGGHLGGGSWHGGWARQTPVSCGSHLGQHLLGGLVVLPVPPAPLLGLDGGLQCGIVV